MTSSGSSAGSGALDPDDLTRNLGELLQELRVVQTGVQILTGFLLTVPFSSRFEDLQHREVVLYLVVLCGAVLTTTFFLAPVAFHRVLFRQRRRLWLVQAAHHCARVGLVLLALTTSGVLLLVFDVVVGLGAGVTASGLALATCAGLWVVYPAALGRPDHEHDHQVGEDEPDR